MLSPGIIGPGRLGSKNETELVVENSHDDTLTEYDVIGHSRHGFTSRDISGRFRWGCLDLLRIAESNKRTP